MLCASSARRAAAVECFLMSVHPSGVESRRSLLIHARFPGSRSRVSRPLFRVRTYVQRLQRGSEQFSRKPGPSNPTIHSTFTFTRENIIGEIIFGWSDFVGNTSRRPSRRLMNSLGCLRMIVASSSEWLKQYIKACDLPSLPFNSLNLVFEWVKEAQ